MKKIKITFDSSRELRNALNTIFKLDDRESSLYSKICDKFDLLVQDFMKNVIKGKDCVWEIYSDGYTISCFVEDDFDVMKHYAFPFDIRIEDF